MGTANLKEVCLGPAGPQHGRKWRRRDVRTHEGGSTAQAPFNECCAPGSGIAQCTFLGIEGVDVYKKDALLALEAVAVLRNAETFSDAYELGHRRATGLVPTPERHQLHKEIESAKGSFSAIYFGTWGSGTNVALKCLLSKKDDRLNTELRERFIQVADLWFKLAHPYVLKLYGACHVTSPPFFVCELSREGDLSTFLKTDRGKSKLWRLLFQSALAIEYLHGKRIVHGNLALNNILVGPDGYARVAGFGVSRYKMPGRDLAFTVLGPDAELDGAGALRWRAPEALYAKAQFQSDVYSFAMCLIEAIGGEIPYCDVEDDDEVRRRISAGELPTRPEDMDDHIWELVKKMTIHDGFQRATINDIIPELRKQAADEHERERDRTVCPKCRFKLDPGGVQLIYIL